MLLAAQGVLASTAIQPGASNNVFINSAGYITSGNLGSITGSFLNSGASNLFLTNNAGYVPSGNLGSMAFQSSGSFARTGANISVFVNDSNYLVNANITGKVDKETGKGLSEANFLSIEKTKLSGISSGATLNSPDSYLVNRSNHTGIQNVSTISGLGLVATTNDYNSLTGRPSFGTAAFVGTGSFATAAQGTKIDSYPSFVARSQSSVSRSLNSAFQISSTRDSLTNYSVSISTSLSLTGGTAGSAYLEISPNGSNGWVEVCRVQNSNLGALTIGLSLSQNMTFVLNGYIPAGYYCRLRTENNTGTPTFGYVSGQEILL